MSTLKSMHDLRTIRSVRTRPSGKAQVFIEIHRLAEERKRLECELEMSTQKFERIERRMEEIEQQIQEQMATVGYVIRGTDTPSDAPHQPETEIVRRRGEREVTLEY